MSLLAGTVPLAESVPLAGTVPLAESDAGKGSPIGLFVVLLLVVATYLLYRSMSRHIRKLPDRFPGYRAADGETGPEAESPPAADDAARPDGAATEPTARPGPAGEAGDRPGPS